MKAILNQLINQETLSRAQAKDVLTNIGQNKYQPVEIAAFITTFLMRNIAVDELLGFRDALIELAIKIDLDQDSIDLCGTGGDGKDTFNISTLSAFVVAGAGYKVVKHGNYAASSVSGSSDVLQNLGYQFSNDQSELQQQLDKAGICFLHAPMFHPALKEVAPVRRALQIKTFFNMLGPLVNPAQPNHQLVGVYDLHIMRLYQYFLQETDKSYAIVHSLDGYDEVTLTSNAKVITNDFDGILSPGDLGLDQIQDPGLLSGGKTVDDAAKIFVNVLENKGTIAQTDAVLANSALAIRCFKPKASIDDCLAEARESLISGNALKTLKSLIG